jgi:DNA ligase 4
MASHTNEEKCGELLFKDLCDKFEKMLKLSKSQQKLALVFNKQLKAHIQGQSLFPLMRLLLPLNDTGRQKYGVKQAAVATTYIEALQLNKSSADASRLKFWKNPTKLNAAVSRVGTGDFCSILEDVLRSRISMDHSTHTIASVNVILDDLSRTVGQKEKVDLIRTRILNSFSAVEQKWLMRIVFQDMKIGLKYEQVLNFLAPNALQRYNECSDLRKVCSEIASGSLGSTTATDDNGAEFMTTSGISVFTCFHPMLARGFPNTGQILEVDKAMKGHPFLMDLKLDGERMLCHVANGRGMFWSRNGNDYSATYRSLCDDVVGSVSCDSCILDGEVCAWDEDTASFIPFGHNRTVARMEDDQRANVLSGYMDDEDDDNGRGGAGGVEGANCRLVYVVFDVIYVEGLQGVNGGAFHDIHSVLPLASLLASISSLTEECRKDCIEAYSRVRAGSGAGDLLHLPLCVRRALIPHVLRLREKRIEIVRSEAVYSCSPSERRTRLDTFFNRVSAEGEEGLVVKDALSPYLLGMRSRQALFWVKMKPEYSDMTKDLDLIILGAYYGEGQSMRGKGLSTFLLGVRDDSSSAYSSSSQQALSAPSTQSFSSQTVGLSQPGDAASQRSTVKYKSLCKVGTGYNFQELEELRQKLKDKIVPWDRVNKQNLPPHFSPWRIGKNDDVPDVWIRPADSIIVELKCAEIVQSTQFSAGVTCRFPRLRKIRYDKGVGEVMCVSEVEEVMRNPRMNTDEASRRTAEGAGRKGKGAKKKATLEGLGPSTRFTGSKVASQFMVPKFSEDFRNVGCAFAEMVFCVLESEYRIPEECHVTPDNGATLLDLVGKDGKISREQVSRCLHH